MNEDFEPACRRMEWLDPFYKQVWEKAFAEGIPISGTFELTPRCNFNCKMCYVHLKEDQISKHGKELSADEWLRIAKEAKEAGTTWLCITGGEPLLHPEFSKIWKGLSQMGFFLTLQTNGSLIKGDILKLLEEYPPRQVKITLYGSNDEVYEAVCGIKDGFARVNDGIHTLMSMGIPVTLVSTIIEQNAKDVEKMAFYAYMHQLPWISTSSIKNSERHDGIDVSSLQVKKKLEQNWKDDVRKRLKKGNYFKRNQKPCTYCRDYRIGYWILWDGTMRFCSMMNEPNISICNQSFQESWMQLLRYEETLDWPDRCKSCNAFEICAKCAATVANHTSQSVVNNGYCDIVRLEYNLVKKERKDNNESKKW